jgi:hypothetical protein
VSLYADFDNIYKISLGANGFETEENLKFWKINWDSTVIRCLTRQGLYDSKDGSGH